MNPMSNDARHKQRAATAVTRAAGLAAYRCAVHNLTPEAPRNVVW